MGRTVYSNKGNKVEIHGTLVVRAANGRIVDRYSVEEIERAIEAADELAESDAVNLIAA